MGMSYRAPNRRKRKQPETVAAFQLGGRVVNKNISGRFLASRILFPPKFPTFN